MFLLTPRAYLKIGLPVGTRTRVTRLRIWHASCCITGRNGGAGGIRTPDVNPNGRCFTGIRHRHSATAPRLETPGGVEPPVSGLMPGILALDEGVVFLVVFSCHRAGHRVPKRLVRLRPSFFAKQKNPGAFRPRGFWWSLV